VGGNRHRPSLRAREATTKVSAVMGAAAVIHAAPGQQEESVPVSVPRPAPNKRLQPTASSVRCAAAFGSG
jgi:hypothetical protein